MKPADIILQQFGGKRAMAMIGGYHIFSDGDNKLVFKFKASRKYNYCTIELDEALDLYNMKIQKYNWKKMTSFEPIKEEIFDGVYADQLQDLFESTTGLYLNL